MADENVKEQNKKAANAEDAESGEEEPEKKEQRVMCYISKQMVPLSQTVEVVYSARKKYRVVPEFIKY